MTQSPCAGDVLNIAQQAPRCGLDRLHARTRRGEGADCRSANSPPGHRRRAESESKLSAGHRIRRSRIKKDRAKRLGARLRGVIGEGETRDDTERSGGRRMGRDRDQYTTARHRRSTNGVVYHHRGANLSADVQHPHTGDVGRHPVYLWATAECSHCNGWLSSWAISVKAGPECLQFAPSSARQARSSPS